MEVNIEDKRKESDIFMHETTNPWSVIDASVFLKYHCPECDFYDGDLEMFSGHALENHINSIVLFEEKKPLIMPEIKMSTNEEFDLEDKNSFDHQEISDFIVIKCDICDLKFNSLEILDLHNSATHQNEIGLNCCHLCNLKVNTIDALKSHIDAKHPEHDEKKYFCKNCDKSFIFQSTYKSHMQKEHFVSRENKTAKLEESVRLELIDDIKTSNESVNETVEWMKMHLEEVENVSTLSAAAFGIIPLRHPWGDGG